MPQLLECKTWDSRLAVSLSKTLYPVLSAAKYHDRTDKLLTRI